MNQDSYKMNYDHFDRSYVAAYPRRTRISSAEPSFASRFKKPLVLSVSLFCLGGFAASMLVNSLSDSPVADETLPLIQADLSPVREVPLERGGMDVPNRESTVFTTMRAGSLAEQAPVIEPSAGDESVERLKAFAAEAETKLEQEAAPANLLDPVPMDQDSGAAPRDASADSTSADPVVAEKSEKVAAVITPAPERKPMIAKPDVPKVAAASSAKPRVENLLADAPAPDDSALQDVTEDPKVIVSNEKIPPKIQVAHASNSVGFQKREQSSETLDFVRSVLEKKDARTIVGNAPAQPVATAAAPVASYEREALVAAASETPPIVETQLATVKPRAPITTDITAAAPPMPSPVETPAATPAAAPVPPQDQAIDVASVQPASGIPASAEGTYYVQLSSVPSESGAAAEWTKIQASFGDHLIGQPHRVARADLGEKGVYYRIQAGPYSKEAAAALCTQIKIQKPGGCLVVQ